MLLSKLPILSKKAGQTLWGRLLVIYVSCRPDLLNLLFANSLDSAFTVICKIDDQKLPKVFICKIVPYGFFRNYFQTEKKKKVFNLAFFCEYTLKMRANFGFVYNFRIYYMYYLQVCHKLQYTNV